MENYSLSDIASAANGGEFGGNMGFFWIFALLLLANGGFGGFGNNGYSQFATAASQNEILNGQHFDRISQQINAIGDGISSLGYAQANQMNQIQSNLGSAITSEGRAIQTQIAECCCSTKEAIHAEGEATRSLIQQNKIDALQSRLNTVEMQQAIGQATAGVVRYPTSSTYSAGTNPYCGCNCSAI